jgi:signal peptidase I
MSKPVVRGFIAEWAVTIVILLFGTTTVLQAFVIPSGSMEGTLLVGDHLIVDKLVYSPPDAVSKHVLPCRDVQRGDVIVFRYPPGLEKNLVKRAIGVPGDRIRLENKRLVLNGIATDEPYARHLEGSDPYRDNLLVFRRARLGHGRDYLRMRLNASSANSRSEISCAAVTQSRSLAAPSGTAGNRIGVTQIPISRNRPAVNAALTSSLKITGMIGVFEFAVS